jgi:tetratricopeptide (TPR) repeat protein
MSELARSEAVRLFLDRGRVADPDFRLTAEVAGAVEAICARIDGLPLALELAAARLRVLTPREIQKRLSGSLDLLSLGMRDADARHRTLRATIEWSYALLGAEEQSVLDGLSVCSGGCTLEAAEAICASDTIDVFEAMATLVESNLVNRRADTGGESRYWLFETIHDYAREQLARSGRAPERHSKHAAYVAAFAEQAETEIAEGDTSHCLARLEQERDNILKALDWSTNRGDPEVGARIVAALCEPWMSFASLAEGRHWTTLLLEQGEVTDSVASARLLHAAAHFAEGLDGEESQQLFERCLEISRRIGYTRGIVLSINSLAMAAATRGDTRRSESLGEEAARLAEQFHDAALLEQSLGAISVSAFARGDHAKVIATDERILQLARAGDDRRTLGRALGNLANSHLWAGNYADARRSAEEGLAIQYELSSKAGIAWACANLGLSLLLLGDVDEAESKFTTALELTREFGHTRRAAESMYGLAASAAHRGEVERAVRIAAAASGFVASVGEPLSRPEQEIDRRYLQPLSSKLDQGICQRLRLEASALTLGEAIDLALARGSERPNPSAAVDTIGDRA